MKLNLQGVESTGLKPMEPGTYDAVCFEARETVAKSSGNPMINFVFKVTEPKYDGRRLFLNVTLLQQTMWKAKQVIEAILGEELPSEDGVDVELQELIGRPCRVTITNEEYEGNTRERVQGVKAAGGHSTTSTRPSLFS